MATKNEGVLVRMTPEMLAALDEYRRNAEGIPSRPEVVRQIVAKALNISETRQASNG